MWLKTLRSFRKTFSLDYRSLAVFRIGLAGILFIDLLRRLGDLSAFYTDGGLLSRADVVDLFFIPGGWSLHLISGDASIQLLLFILQLLAALFLLIGYHTRWVTFLSWALLLSLQNRAPVILTGGDEVLRHLLFWSMFLPLSQMFSVDAALNKNPSTLPSSKVFSGGTVALTLQVICLYVFSALLKTGAEWHAENSAVYYALRIHTITTPLAPLFMNLTSQFPQLTSVVYYLELIGPLFLLSPWKNDDCRWGVIFLLALLNLCFGAAFYLGLFPWINLVTLLALIPSSMWEEKKKSLFASKPSFSLYYDGECRVCKKGVYLLREFLILPHVKLQPAQDSPIYNPLMKTHHSWIVQPAQGDMMLKADALTFCLQQSPWLFFMAPVLQWQRTLANALYEKVANHRPQLFQLSQWLCWRSISSQNKPLLNIAMSLIAIVLAGYMVFMNLLSLQVMRGESPSLSLPLQWVTTAFGLGQSWSMFAPYPMKETQEAGLFLMKDGQIQAQEALHYHGQERWTKWMVFITFPEIKPGLVRQYARYLCREKLKEKNSPEFNQLRLYFLKKSTPPPNSHGEAFQRVFIWEESCLLKESQSGVFR